MINIPEATGEVTLQERKTFICPHCKKVFEEDVVIIGEATIEFEMSDYAPDRDEP